MAIDVGTLEVRVKTQRTQLEEIKNRKATLVGQRDTLFSQMKENHGTDTIEEGEALKGKLEARKAEIVGEI